MEYNDFLTWAQRQEPLLVDNWISKQSFEYALKSQESVRPYFSPVNYRAFIFAYAMHLIIITQSEDNPLYDKYFPKENGGKNQFGLIPSSVSDSTSSVSNTGFKALNDMSFQEAMMMETNYGVFCNSLLDSLKNAIVVV